MVDYPIVDSHIHLLEPARFGYSWTKNAPSLNRRVLPSDLTQAAPPVVFDPFVFVAAFVYLVGAGDRPQHSEEARGARARARAVPGPQGMVGALPMERGKAVEPELDQLRRHKLLRSIRRLIQNQPDPEFCVRPDFIAAL